MDIHPPEGPTRSFRDFLIHIGVVTIGILIALSLETVLETVHNRHVVREARENFAEELRFNQSQLVKERKNVTETLGAINAVVEDLPVLRLHPADLRGRIARISPSGYFFLNERWDTALSSGALGHMDVDEVNRYAGVTFIVRAYTVLEAKNNEDWTSLEAYLGARANLGPAETEEGVERLLIWQADEHSLAQVAADMDRDLKRAAETR